MRRGCVGGSTLGCLGSCMRVEDQTMGVDENKREAAPQSTKRSRTVAAQGGSERQVHTVKEDTANSFQSVLNPLALVRTVCDDL